MCYYYAIKPKVRLEDSSGEKFESSYLSNGFTSPKRPVITQKEPSKINQYYWGLIPFWVKNFEEAEKIRINLLNARSETVFEKPSFKYAIKTRRCLVLADGFYEWKEVNKKKYPHFIYLKNGESFSFAGIYESWTDKKTGEILNTFAILTTKANKLMSEIHNTKQRMPIILRKEDETLWLDLNLPETEIKRLMETREIEDLTAHPVSRLINQKNKGKIHGPEIQEPFFYPELFEGAKSGN